jgi:hypothetical protein
MSQDLDPTKLWRKIKKLGYKTRKNRINGLAAWQQPKIQYSRYRFTNYPNGLPLGESFVNFAQKLQYQYSDIDHQDASIRVNNFIIHNMYDTEHFIIQLFRIPKMCKYELPVTKFLQLAYNIGQIEAVMEFEKEMYHENVTHFYNSNKLNQLETYFDRYIIEKGIIEAI